MFGRKILFIREEKLLLEDHEICYLYELIIGIGLFILSVAMFFSHVTSYDNVLKEVGKAHLKDHSIYQTQIMKDPWIVSGGELASSLLTNREYDVEVDNFVIRTTDVAFEYISLIDINAEYYKSYECDNTGIIKVKYIHR